MDTTRKPGPIAGPTMLRTNVLLPPEMVEWAKRQPGGLSKTVRRLLTEEWERASRPTPVQTDVANPAFNDYGLVVPTAEELAADEAQMQAWYDSLTPEEREQKRAILAERLKSERFIPFEEAMNDLRERIRQREK